MIPILALVTAFAVDAVLILAGAGGYWLKGLVLQGAATVSVTSYTPAKTIAHLTDMRLRLATTLIGEDQRT